MTSATLGSLELAILLAVARLGDEAYGLAVRRNLAACTGRDYSVGAVYSTPERLETPPWFLALNVTMMVTGTLYGGVIPSLSARAR